jgi:DNA-binding response OmpR family regulator
MSGFGEETLLRGADRFNRFFICTTSRETGPPMSPTCLLVTPDAHLVIVVSRELDELGIRTEVTANEGAARDLLKTRKFHAVMVDADKIGETGELLQTIRHSKSNSTVIILVLATSNTNLVINAAANFIVQRPFTTNHLQRVLRASTGLILRNWSRSTRYKVEIPVTVMLPSAGRSPATIINVSEGGLALKTETRLNQHEIVRLQFAMAPFPRPIQVRGLVVWSKMNHAGISFVGIPEQEKTAIREWLAAQADAQLEHNKSGLQLLDNRK